MKRTGDIRQFFQKATLSTRQKTDDAVQAMILRVHDKATDNDSATARPGIRSMTMKNPITKLAVAAAIIAAVVLGLFEFIDTGSTSGVVWAEVAQKVQASRSVIFHATQRTAPPSYHDKIDFSVNHYCPTRARLDRYKGGEIVNTMYDNCETKTVILVDHIHKSYVQYTNAEGMPDSFQMTDPNSIIQRFLSCDHRKLGRKTIDDVLCEGIETTDLAFHGGDHPPDSLVARIWVSVETGYPVQIDDQVITDGGESRFECVMDQFQWDVELDESLFEPDIPAGYIDISPDEW